MPDPFTTPGLVFLIGAALVAGLVRGFAGFGTAMIYLPVAGQFLSPFAALTTLIAMDLIGPLPNMPRAMRDGHLRDIGRLTMGLLVGVPLGVWALSLVSADTFRYGVSLISLGLLILLVAGVRYARELPNPMVVATGGLGGVLCGSVGLPGPPVILFYMAAPHPAAVIRANITMYLLFADVILLAVMAVFGELVPAALGLGVLVAVPYLIGNVAGGRLFRPGAERLYRRVAYLIIGISALSGLPIFD